MSFNKKQYFKWLSRKCCILCGAEAEIAHVRMSDARFNKRNGRDDKWVVPLCANHHRLGPDSQHSRGERIWWSRHGVDAVERAHSFYEEWVDSTNQP